MRNPLGGHERTIGLTISARSARCVLRPDRHRVRIGHPSAIAGNASIAWTGQRRERPRTPFQRNASGGHRGGNGIARTALGRHPRERHPTVIASISAGNDCPRRSSWGTPADANMAGGSARPSGVVPPNQRMQPDAVPAARSFRFYVVSSTQTPSRSLGAARLMRKPLGGSHQPPF
jgi:hypothetical protein